MIRTSIGSSIRTSIGAWARPRALAAALGAAAVALVPAAVPPAHAQPASALGKPLPDGALAAGTVTVRVVAGSPGAAVVGAEVTLLVNNEPRTARTDAAGRATFAGLPAGATAQARILDAEQQEQTSESFPVPASGGVRVMLTTKPFADGGMAAPAMGGGAAGMPDARQMSGRPRQDREVPAGAYQVRLTYNNLVMQGGKPVDPQPPAGATVTLVGYAADETVSVQTAAVDDQGHARFDGLDRSGRVNYFAMAQLPRGPGADRLFAVPVQPDSRAGYKVILSADKRDATTPLIDEAVDRQPIETPAGKVRVTLDGFPTEASVVRLIDAATRFEVGRGVPQVPEPDPSAVEAGSQFAAAADLPPGTLDIKVHGGAGTADAPLRDVAVRVVPAADASAAGLASKTTADGTVRLAVAPGGGEYKVVLDINGKELTTTSFKLDESGGRLDVVARWPAEGRPEVLLDLVPRPGQVLYAETTQRGQLYRSMPFQPLAHTGTHVGVVVYPRILFGFSLRAFVEDEYLAVRGQFHIDNNSWIPYQASNDGLLVPLPRGFTGAVVAEEHQDAVSAVPGEGFRILRPLGIGRTGFIGGFTLVSDGGAVDWSLDLPLGSFNSGIEVRRIETDRGVMQLSVAGDAPVRTAQGRDGHTWYVVDGITIRPGQSMAMRFTNLPSQPPWKKWVPRIVGIAVAALMLGGLGLALFWRRRPLPDAGARREALLAELVELERAGGDPARREQVVAELERIWRDDD